MDINVIIASTVGLFVITLLSCQNETDSSYVIFRGQLLNNTANTLKISGNNFEKEVFTCTDGEETYTQDHKFAEQIESMIFFIYFRRIMTTLKFSLCQYYMWKLNV